MSYGNQQYSAFSELQGKTLTRIEVEAGGYEIDFYTACGRHYQMRHEQDCCESVSIDDICGDLNDLLGAPLTVAEEVSNLVQIQRLIDPSIATKEQGADSFTWTFYKLDTAKGGVTIRWFGESNGYYSESVSFLLISPPMPKESLFP